MTIVRLPHLARRSQIARIMNNFAIAGLGEIPVLDLNFVGSANPLPSSITFTRASGGTRVNSVGLIELLGNNEARFDYDPVTLAPRGLLLEESRTNLSPNGSVPTNYLGGVISGSETYLGQTFTLFTANGLSSQHLCSFTASTLVASTTYTLCVYFKMLSDTRVQITGSSNWIVDTNAYVNINNGVIVATGASATNAFCTHVGNGVYRAGFTCQTAVVPTSGPPVVMYAITADGDARGPTNTSTASWYCFGAQIEAGAFPTSYIPTAGAAVTRAADLASMTGTNFSSWYNTTEGTIIAQTSETFPANATAAILSINDGTVTNRTQFGIASSQRNVFMRSSDSMDSPFPSPTILDKVSQKTGIAYALNDSVAAFSGTLGTTDTAITPSALVDRIAFGNSPTGAAASVFNGHIQRFTYYNKRLPDATLQALSA